MKLSPDPAVARLEAKVALMQKALFDAQSERELILQSTTWRVTSNLRRLVGALPGSRALRHLLGSRDRQEDRRAMPSAPLSGGAGPTGAQITRNDMLLSEVADSSLIIEIGPSYNPVAAKADGWNTRTLDHMTQQDLVKKYTGHPVNVNRIEEVDFIWREGPLSDAVPSALHGTFDAFIASHVIEHTPDLIAFLDSAAMLLKQEGLVILAVPDKRYCFDYFQPLTTTGQILEAHAERRSRHTRRLAFDHYAYMVHNGGTGAWGQKPLGRLNLPYPLESARDLFNSFEDDSNYIDLHAWRFSPSSFSLLLLELARLGETDWRVDRTTEARDCEFFAWLRRGGKEAATALSSDELAARRLMLLERTLMETREQVDWLLAGG